LEVEEQSLKVKTPRWITLLIVELIHEVKARGRTGGAGAVTTERKKSDFRRPSTRHGAMRKAGPGKDRRGTVVPGHPVYRRVAFVSKASKLGEQSSRKRERRHANAPKKQSQGAGHEDKNGPSDEDWCGGSEENKKPVAMNSGQTGGVAE
jgi:hypothetical protein